MFLIILFNFITAKFNSLAKSENKTMINYFKKNILERHFPHKMKLNKLTLTFTSPDEIEFRELYFYNTLI